VISPQWLAGFFDGEGNIGITVAGKHRRCILRLSLVNTAYDLLASIQSEYGGQLNRRSRSEKPHWKPFCSLTWTNRQAAILIDRIGLFLILKSKQLDLARVFLSLRDSPNRFEIGSLPHLKVRERNFVRRLDPGMLQIENDIKSKMHELNKKGRAA